MMTRTKPLFLILLGLFLVPMAARAQDPWEKRASISVPRQGLVETRLLPGLHESMDRDRFDLTLTGPDGRQRAMELFMDYRNQGRTVDLVPKNVRLTDSGSFVWEADGPAMAVSRLSVTSSEPRFVATVRAEGQSAGRWRVLAENEALYDTGSVSRAEFSVPAGTYSAIRLTFTGFDPKNARRLLPIGRVTASSPGTETRAEGYAVRLSFAREDSADTVELKARLDGSGIFIRTLTLKSQAPFLGRYELGREEIRDGRLVFVPVEEGVMEALNAGNPTFSLDINRRWPGHSLVLRLFPEGKYIGNVTAMDMEILTPRILFSADRPGVYHLATGTGSAQSLLAFSRTGETSGQIRLGLENLEVRADRQVRRLVEKYPLEGGPFTEQGYTWQARVQVGEPGFYRLIVHEKAGLDNHRNGMRIVREGVQVPFLFSSPYTRPLPLTPVASYDEEENRTSWEINLPMPSKHWTGLDIRATGMFTRIVECLIRKEGAGGWKPWQTLTWTNELSGETSLRIPLDPVSAQSGRFLVRIAHADNRPIDLSKVEAEFSSTDLLFLARVPGEYLVYGGHPEADVPVYDLSMVRDELLAAVPSDLPMPEPSALGQAPLLESLGALFQGKSWGLYIVLGLVTVILMGLVSRLFPKSPEKPE